MGVAVVAGVGLYLRDLHQRIDDLERRGAAGSFVALMRSNPTVAPGETLTELVTLRLPPGRYQVFAKVGLHNRGPLPFQARCALVPSSEDGTPGSSDAVEADVGFLHLAAGAPGELGEFSLSVSQQLHQQGSIVLGCDGYGNELGAFASYGSIRAIEVDSIDTNLVTP